MIAAATASVRHPFPGLRPFEPDEDHLFFGREREIDELLRRLRTTRFLAIVGTSGCGKSSLVRSGLIPSLHGGAMTRAGSSWRVAVMRPGEAPIDNLAAALDTPEAIGGAEGGDELSRGLLATALRASRQGLVECVREARIPATDNLLVLVDQFEELFRFKQGGDRGRDEAVAFVKLLLTAARHRDVRVYVALTMRSDFIGNCLELAELPEAINAGLYLVPRMTRDELRAAIEGPVAVGGGAIAPRLVSRLLNDVGDDPDQLPILQHALMRTWDLWLDDHAPGEPLDLRHYEAVGTMKEALSRHAEEALNELDERGRRVAESLFKALTEKEADGRGIRRPASVAEAATLTGATVEEIAAVAEPFRRTGRSFLMPPAHVPLRGDSVLDISHESLMRIWGRLVGWVEEEARSAQVYIGLARAAARHEAGITALWRDPELQMASNWRREQQPTAAWAGRYDPSFARAMRFLDASAAERDREAAERSRLRRRALRRAWMLSAVFATAAVGMLALGVFAFVQKGQAESALAQAIDAQKRARRAAREATRLGRLALVHELSLQALRPRESDAVRGLTAVLALQAYRLNRTNGGAPDDPDLWSALWMGRLRWEGEENLGTRQQEAAVRAIVVDPDEAKGGLVTGGDDGKVRRLVDGSWVLLGSFKSGVRSLVASEWIAAGQRRELLAAAFADGSVRLWEDGRSVPRELLGRGAAAGALAFDAVEGWLAAGGADGVVRIWSLRAPAEPPLLLGTRDHLAVTSLAFARAGDRPILAAGLGGPGTGAEVWRTAPAAAHSPSVTLQLAGGEAVSFQEPEIACGNRDVRSIALSPQGKTLVCATGSGEIVLWERGAKAASLAGHTATVNALSFNPQGTSLASASDDRTVRIWDLARRGDPPIVLSGHASEVLSLAHDVDPRLGEVWISGGADRTVRIWPAHTRSLATALCASVPRSMTREEWDLYMPAEWPYNGARPCPP
ncbi:MAG TPA: hypothetical protein VGS57_18470 [Thermoanaerobaculia bacterium]|nr:hypothetical protein [Thermoanaerobaculia bacterium]